MDVLIVGGGLTGLTTAAFLAASGVSCQVLEREPDIPRAPRNHRLTDDTMRVLATIGLDGPVKGIAEARHGILYAVDTLADEEPVRMPTPTQGLTCNERKLELLMLAQARRLGADVRLGVTAPDDLQHDARYLIAADDGTIRRRLGIGTQGPGTLAHLDVIRFRADLPGTDGFMIKSVQGILLPDEPGHWSLTVPQSDDPVEVLATALATDTPPEILAITPMRVAAEVAERFVVDQTVLMAKSAYVAPPTPGLHGNLRIQDAHALATRLTTVLAGQAPATLLDDFDTERRPHALKALEGRLI